MINPTFDGFSWEVGKISQELSVIEASNGTFYEQSFWVFNQGNVISREVYNFLDILGDLGGMLGLFQSFVAFFVLPISEFSFNLEMINHLFMAKTSDQSILKDIEETDECKSKLKKLSKRA